MNKRLDTAIEAARRTLGEDAQEELAALVENYLSGWTLDSEARLTPEDETRLEHRLDAEHPVAEPAEHDRWFRMKVNRAVRDADADPGRGTLLAEMRMKFGLEP